MDDIIDLNVGGTQYTTSRSTLTRYPDSMLASMFSGRLPTPKDKEGRYWIDGDGRLFRHILNFLRRSELTLPSDFTEHALLEKEADYYQLTDLVEEVQRHEQNATDDFVVLDFHNTDKDDTVNKVYVRLKIWASPEILSILKSKLEGVNAKVENLSPSQWDGGKGYLEITDIKIKLYISQACIMREIQTLGYNMCTMPEYYKHEPNKHHIWFKRGGR